MSFLLGPVSGAVLAGGIYYGLSTMIRTRTEQHQADLHQLSASLIDASAISSAPPSAAARIEHRPLVSLMKSRWNSQVETLFRSVAELNGKAVEWSRETLYGGEIGVNKRSS